MTRKLVTAVALVAAAAAVASPASALTWTNTLAPGSVHWTYPIQGSHFMVSTPYGGVFSPQVSHQGITTCRSPRTRGTQTVEAEYRVYRWNGSIWALTGPHGLLRTTIPAGVNCARLPNFYSFTFDSSVYLSVAATYRWRDAYGSFLGAQHISFNAATDYRCAAAPFRRCEIGPGYIFLG